MSQEFETERAQPGSVAYMNAPTIRRGLKMEGRAKLTIIALAAAAFFIAGLVGMRINDAVASAPERYAASIEASVDRGVSLNLPVLSNYTDSDNNNIREALTSAGIEYIDVDALYSTSGEPDAKSLDLVSVPSDMTLERTQELFTGNLRREPAAEVLSYLATSWRFTSFRVEGIDLKVKYCDFQSETIEEAIMAAIAAQGWSESAFGDTGVDASGNTFQNGTVQVNDRYLNWTVSACPLDEVYNVNGLPLNSWYVGARLVQ